MTDDATDRYRPAGASSEATDGDPREDAETAEHASSDAAPELFFG